MKTDCSAQHLLRAYRNEGAIIDTNILLLYVVGRHDRKLVLEFKRTKKYDLNDYALVHKILSFFSNIIVLPNILTEVSNLLNQIGSPKREAILSSMTGHFTIWKESFIPSLDASRWKYYTQFGLTDSAIALLAEKKYLVITDDIRFSSLLQGQNIDVVNVNHLRACPGFQ